MGSELLFGAGSFWSRAYLVRIKIVSRTKTKYDTKASKEQNITFATTKEKNFVRENLSLYLSVCVCVFFRFKKNTKGSYSQNKKQESRNEALKKRFSKWRSYKQKNEINSTKMQQDEETRIENSVNTSKRKKKQTRPHISIQWRMSLIASMLC
jgi:hypothetical protein